MIVTRFAPSPNGPLHLGHAYSAIVAHDLARAANARGEGGRFLLRIEDIDGARSRPHLADQFRRDLEWLGLEWEEVPAQSTRLASYAEAAERLAGQGLLYACTCTRSELAACPCKSRQANPKTPCAWRLDMAQAAAAAGPLVWEDALAGVQPARPEAFGDLVLVRKDAPASYHLAATLDDAEDGVTLVTRGADLFAASHVHQLLQALLGLAVPRWHHHALLLDAGGQKLAKSRKSGELGWGLAERRQAGEDGRALAQKLLMGQMPAGISLSPYPHEGP